MRRSKKTVTETLPGATDRRVAALVTLLAENAAFVISGARGAREIGFSRSNVRKGGGRVRRTEGRAGRRGARVAFRARDGDIRDTAVAAETGTGAGAAADDDGGAFGTRRDSGTDGAYGGPEVAERFADRRKKGGRNPDGDARGAGTSSLCDCGDRIEREPGQVSGRAGGKGYIASCRKRPTAIAAGAAGAVADGIRARLQ